MNDDLLRRALIADAAVSGAFALLCLALSGWLTGALALPGWLVTGAVIVCLGASALMAVTAAQRPMPPALVWLVILGNLGWIVASLSLAAFGVAGTATGTLLIVAQALGVAGLTALELAGARRDGAATARP
ncbi:hypothetical protein [Pseudooceanicola sp. LIPI14-2-Ac024]|uniref:hypothetical protein n=1 Tax=Pseudooceanicola sp. LIPI14-2-Ac024 TaxID=3344875 RepID=UPI0035D128BE